MTKPIRTSLTLLVLCGAVGACDQDYSISAQPPEVNPEDVTECDFSPIGGTTSQSSLFRRYDCNPVFTDSDEGWAEGVRATGFHAELVLGHPFYQLWYTASTQGCLLYTSPSPRDS